MTPEQGKAPPCAASAVDEPGLAQILDASPIPTFVLNSQHDITHWNRALEVISGYPRVQVVGRRDAWRAFYQQPRPVLANLIVEGADASRLAALYGVTVRPSPLIDGAYETEGFFRNFGSNGRWLFFTAAPIHDGSGRVVGAIETLQDVTERYLAQAALKDSEARFRELSITDSLTGLYNSRHFFASIEAELNRATRYAEPLCLLLMDVDNFKRVNDSHGHLEGDCVLSRLAATIRSVQRTSDSAFRYGGEEFVVLLPATRMADALHAAERLRQHFAGAPIPLASGALLHASVSIGVAQFELGESAVNFIRRADAACYQAKHAGKNCVRPFNPG